MNLFNIVGEWHICLQITLPVKSVTKNKPPRVVLTLGGIFIVFRHGLFLNRHPAAFCTDTVLGRRKKSTLDQSLDNGINHR